MKEQIKVPEKIQLSDEEIANLSDAQFKTLVIRILTEMVEYGYKNRGRSEGYEKWNTGNNRDGKETRTQINNLDQKEEINIQLDQERKTRTLKNEERLRNLQDNFKCSDFWIIGMPERARNWKLIWKNNERNFLNLVKEIDVHIYEAQRVPKKLHPRRNTPRQIIITLPKIKDEERFLKAARGKQMSYLQMSAHKTISWFPKRNLTGKKGLERSIQSHERQGPISKITLSSKAII